MRDSAGVDKPSPPDSGTRHSGPGSAGPRPSPSQTLPQADYSRKWWILAVVMIGGFMTPFDTSIVNLGLPTLTSFFGVPLTTAEWVILAYLLTVTTLLLTFGRLGDMLGLKRVFVAGFLVFIAGSFGCGLAWGIWPLIGFRVVQGLGASLLFSVVAAIATRSFPPNERGKALGFWAVAVALGLAVGPTLGGLIMNFFGWRWLFMVNVPIGIAACILALVVVPRDSPTPQRFDPMGAGLSFIALFPLLLALSKGEAWGWKTPAVAALFALAAIGLVLFVRTELRVTDPVLDLRLFRVRLFSAATGSAIASYVVMSTVLFIMPFYLLKVRGFNVAYAGLLLTPLPMMTGTVGPLSGRLSDRIGSRLLATSGLVMSALAVASFSTLGMSTPAWRVALVLIIAGVGNGMFQSPNSSAIMGAVPQNRLGIASGMVATARQTGMVLGVSLAGLVLAVRQPVYLHAIAAHLTADMAARESLLHAIHDVGLVAAAVCLLGAVGSLVRGGTRQHLAWPEEGGGQEPAANRT